MNDLSKINAMCERKTADIMQREGYAKTGYVLMSADKVERICVSDQGAVAWFTRDEWNWLMHNRDHVEFSWPKPVGTVEAPAVTAEMSALSHVGCWVLNGAGELCRAAELAPDIKDLDSAYVALSVVKRVVLAERERAARLALQWSNARHPDCGGNALRAYAQALRDGVQVCEDESRDYHWSKAPASPAAPAGEWSDAERICNLPAVHEVIQGFADDRTGDNAIMVVREVMRALAAPQQHAQASDPIGQHNAEAAQQKLVEHAQAAQAEVNAALDRADAEDASRFGAQAALSDALPPLHIAAQNVVAMFSDPHMSLASVARYVNELGDVLAACQQPVADMSTARTHSDDVSKSRSDLNMPQPVAATNADCSSDPSSCPDNEGYGCACTPEAAPIAAAAPGDKLQAHLDASQEMEAVAGAMELPPLPEPDVIGYTAIGDNDAYSPRALRLHGELFWLKVGDVAAQAPLASTAVIASPAGFGFVAARPRTAEEAACWCAACRPVTMDDNRMVLCPTCGNKRCPRADDHHNVCGNSNLPGQVPVRETPP